MSLPLTKKTITLTVETHLTKAQIEESLVRVLCCDAGADEEEKANALCYVAEEVRVVELLPDEVFTAKQLWAEAAKHEEAGRVVIATFIRRAANVLEAREEWE